MTNYQRGANFERKVIKELAKDPNYIYAMRSAGSHSIVDIVVFFYPEYKEFNNKIWLIQCSLKGKKSKIKLEELRDLAQECDAIPILASQGPTKIIFDRLDGT